MQLVEQEPLWGRFGYSDLKSGYRQVRFKLRITPFFLLDLSVSKYRGRYDHPRRPTGYGRDVYDGEGAQLDAVGN